MAGLKAFRRSRRGLCRRRGRGRTLLRLLEALLELADAGFVTLLEVFYFTADILDSASSAPMAEQGRQKQRRRRCQVTFLNMSISQDEKINAPRQGRRRQRRRSEENRRARLWKAATVRGLKP